MTDHKSVSLADRVFEKLESDILSGRYAYGEILTEARLSEELNVSRTPVREAIRRLEQENILQETGKGMMVVGITRDDIADILDVRLCVEGMAARRAAQNITDEMLAALAEAVELQEFYAARGNYEHIQSQDHCFHEIIYAACGSTTLQNTLLPLHRKAQKYRRASVERAGRAVASVAEHRAIYEALAAHDADAAEEAVLTHIRHARESMLGE